MNWVLEHIDDPDFNDPLPSAGNGSSVAASDPASVEQLGNMGFTAEQVTSLFAL